MKLWHQCLQRGVSQIETPDRDTDVRAPATAAAVDNSALTDTLRVLPSKE